MDIETYNRREKCWKLREELLSNGKDRMHGSEGYSVDEVASMMRIAIKGGRRTWNSKKVPRDRVSLDCFQMLVSMPHFWQRSAYGSRRGLQSNLKGCKIFGQMPQRCPCGSKANTFLKCLPIYLV